jgi:hypothetical protein
MRERKYSLSKAPTELLGFLEEEKSVPLYNANGVHCLHNA